MINQEKLARELLAVGLPMTGIDATDKPTYSRPLTELEQQLEAQIIGSHDPVDIDQLRRLAYSKTYTTDEFMEAVVEALVENRPAKLNAIQAKRQDIKNQYPKPGLK